jgi:hypothetical protein
MSDEVEDEVTTHQCVVCDGQYEEDELSTDNDGDWICSDCIRTCERCEWVGSHQSDWYTVDDYSWCEGCWEDHSWTCRRCDYCYDGDRIGYNTVFGESWREDWCEHCISDNAHYCDNCDEYSSDDYEGCMRCGDNEDSRGVVHAYSHKPNPIFHGSEPNNLYMGFELETELNNTTSGGYREAVALVKPLEESGVCYLKSDSSICGTGFEIVTHPHTLSAYEQANELWDYIEKLRTDYKARSWDTDSCGLHVHVSRSAFKSGAHTHRFLSLIYRNPKEMMKLAGRKNSRYAQFSDVYKPDEWGIPRFDLRDKIHGRNFTERYSAVNTNNDYTLELRFFRGNMKREGIMSALELCHASVEYTRDLSVSDVKLGMLKWEWFADWVEVNNGIYPNLYLRMSKVPSVSLDNRPLINA